jgi:transcription initiation factor TFIID TATA-box-binding protein
LKKPKQEIRIVNVVATSDVAQPINISKIGDLPWGVYDPKKYSGRVAYVRSSGMKATVTVFPSGKLISVGAKSEAEASRAILVACKLLGKAGLIRPRKTIAKVQNVVGLTNLRAKIDLETVAKRVGHVIYEPEQFPGAIMRSYEHPEATALIFASGKMVVAGAKSVSSIGRIAEDLSGIIISAIELPSSLSASGKT